MLLNNLVSETELLESLDWDEEKLKELLDYITVATSEESKKTPKEILSEIKIMFSYEASDIIKKIFLEIALSNNLHIAKGDDCEN